MIRHLIALPLILTLLPCAAMAANSNPERNKLAPLAAEIEAFQKSPDGRLAPLAAKRATQLIAAAIAAQSARQSSNTVAAKKALAEQALAEARTVARTFRSDQEELLQLQASAHATAIDPKTNTIYPALESLLIGADMQTDKAIAANEAGRLNEKTQFALAAREAFSKCITTALPDYVDNVNRVLSTAAGNGAKSYAPISWQLAKDELALLQAYIKGVSTQFPRQPERVMQLAIATNSLSEAIREWRKDYGSFETLWLNHRKDMLRIAQALGSADSDIPQLSKPDSQALAERITALREQMETNDRQWAERYELLKKQSAETLAAKLAEQRAQLQKQQGEEVATLKEAFRVKMERETYEKRRLEKLRTLFGTDEVQILVNADGSMLIRLLTLTFAPNKSALGEEYQLLMDSVRSALELYSERNCSVEGHTDDQGDAQKNQLLSLHRAEAVRDYLIAIGVDATRLDALGYGEVRPIASNEFEKGRAMNRRIDLIIEAPHE